MKNITVVLILFSTIAAGMDAPSVLSVSHLLKMKIREERAVRFMDRLAYFNSPNECDKEMTTDSNVESDFEEGLISAEQLIQHKAYRNQERKARAQKIEQGKKNERVASLLKNIALEEKKSLYVQLNTSPISQLPILEALKALGYEADAE